MPFLIFNLSIGGAHQMGVSLLDEIFGLPKAFHPADDTHRFGPGHFLPHATLQGTDHISHQGGKETYLPNCLWMGYVRSQEGST